MTLRLGSPPLRLRMLLRLGRACGGKQRDELSTACQWQSWWGQSGIWTERCNVVELHMQVEQTCAGKAAHLQGAAEAAGG